MKTRGFADDTTVAPEKTRAEIEAVITRYKATAFQSGWDQSSAWIMFVASDRLVRFKIPLPGPTDRRFTHGTGAYPARQPEAKARAAYEQALRTIWRRLLLCIKAKLESVQSGIESFESAFNAHIVMPDGRTVGELMRPAIEAAYSRREGGRPAGPMPPLALGPAPGPPPPPPAPELLTD